MCWFSFDIKVVSRGEPTDPSGMTAKKCGLLTEFSSVFHCLPH